MAKPFYYCNNGHIISLLVWMSSWKSGVRVQSCWALGWFFWRWMEMSSKAGRPAILSHVKMSRELVLAVELVAIVQAIIGEHAVWFDQCVWLLKHQFSCCASETPVSRDFPSIHILPWHGKVAGVRKTFRYWKLSFIFASGFVFVSLWRLQFLSLLTGGMSNSNSKESSNHKVLLLTCCFWAQKLSLQMHCCSFIPEHLAWAETDSYGCQRLRHCSLKLLGWDRKR